MLVAALLAAFGPLVAGAQTPAPTPKPTPWAVQGPEFPVNITTAGNQSAPSIAVREDNLGFIVVWTDDQQDGDGLGVFGRRYDRTGIALSAEFPINTYTAGDQSDAAVAADFYGNFVVVWSSPHAGTSQIFARRFDSSGTPVGPEFQVNTYTTGNQTEPRVAMNTTSFMVVWSSAPSGAETGHDGSGSGIFGQQFLADGTPDGTEFAINTYTTGDQSSPAVATSYGPFIVMWRSEGQDGDQGGVFGQFYVNGPYLPEFPVNGVTTGDQRNPDVGYSNTGVFATWESEGVDGSGSGIAGRLFNIVEPKGPEFQVNTYTTGAQTHPRVSANPFWQDFIVVWESEGQDEPGAPGTGVFAQRFQNKPLVTSAFTLPFLPRRGTEYQVNMYTTGAQGSPAVVLDIAGQFVVAWSSESQVGEGSGVFARRFGSPEPVRALVDARSSGGASNVNGILEPGERVTMDPTWSVRYYDPLPLEGTATNLTGPPGPTYSIDDASADYGTVGFFGADCFTATPLGNCYEVSVSAGSRPAMHWDATLDETLSSTSGPLGPSSNRTKTWALHVGQSFADVPQDDFYPHIENVFHNRVTAGGGCGAASYCGEDDVLRQQMAVLVLKAMYGGDFVPSPATGTVFADVPAASPFAPWIEELARLGVVAGCAAPPPPALPSYCPTATVNRQQMAVFLVKTKNAQVASCVGYFVDVPCDSPFAPYVEYLWTASITGGCQFDPELLYCPTDPTKRKQMAVFLVKTFGLELDGPD